MSRTCRDCPSRERCRRLCAEMEALLRATCSTRVSVRAICFTDLQCGWLEPEASALRVIAAEAASRNPEHEAK